MQKHFSGFFLALSFLSRLVAGKSAEREEISESLDYYPFAGMFLGGVLILPFWAGLGAGKPWLQAFLYVTLSAFLTRALHWDGWADFFDATGSGKEGEDFAVVLKDSRLGSFGGLALVLGLSGQMLLSFYAFSEQAFAILWWSIILGRSCVAPLAAMATPAPWSSLGLLMCERKGGFALPVAIFVPLLSGIACAGFGATLMATLLATCGIWMLMRVAERQGGINGDFFGCSIIWGEFSALLGWAL